MNFERKFICGVIVYEENNELDLENEFYSILLKIQVWQSFYYSYKVDNPDATKKIKSLKLNTYLVSSNETGNLHQTNYVKMDNYY